MFFERQGDMRKLIFGLVLTLSAGCMADETVTAYGGSNSLWRLDTMDGHSVKETVTLEFLDHGRVVGQAPCNRYSTYQTAPYPWLHLSPIVTTRMACPALTSESKYLQALETMTEAEILGDTLILRASNGQELVYRSSDALE